MDALLFGIDPGKHEASAVTFLSDARLSFSHMSLSSGPLRSRRPFRQQSPNDPAKKRQLCVFRPIHTVTYQCPRATVGQTSSRPPNADVRSPVVPLATIRAFHSPHPCTHRGATSVAADQRCLGGLRLRIEHLPPSCLSLG
jgi:hypothetical protein